MAHPPEATHEHQDPPHHVRKRQVALVFAGAVTTALIVALVVVIANPFCGHEPQCRAPFTWEVQFHTGAPPVIEQAVVKRCIKNPVVLSVGRLNDNSVMIETSQFTHNNQTTALGRCFKQSPSVLFWGYPDSRTEMSALRHRSPGFKPPMALCTKTCGSVLRREPLRSAR